jgi:hypothetical protein
MTSMTEKNFDRKQIKTLKKHPPERLATIYEHGEIITRQNHACKPK